MNTASTRTLKEAIEQGQDAIIIDVRTPPEYRSSHITSAKNLPLGDLSEASLEGIASKDDTVYLICQAGGRSVKALHLLNSFGYSNVVNVDGGMNAWSNSGYPVLEGTKSMSIERQVRVAAGSLVVTGVTLSFLIHPGFIGIAAFVGAGLVFSGLTDTCGMGLMIAKMPWIR